jgi:toxin YoeB
MIKSWSEIAWDDYLYWQTQDKKTLRRINALIRDIERNPSNQLIDGIGKLEVLKGDLSGLWSRHIDDANRLVYEVVSNRIEIFGCRGHYDDK